MDDASDAMERAPNHERPACTMPDSAQQERKKQIERDP